MKQFLTLILLSIFSSTFASSTEFTASVSQDRVAVGQRFNISFSINAGSGNFTPPNLANFRVIGGPNQSQSMSYVNGRTSQKLTYSYSLVALKKGIYEIGQATIEINNTIYKTQPIKVQVFDASNNNAAAGKQSTNRSQNQNNSQVENKGQLFIRAIVDKRKLKVGEKMTVTYKLFSRVGINGLELDAKPALNGFWAHNLHDIYDKIQLKEEQIDGVLYQTSELQQTVLYPQRSGTLLIDPMKLTLGVNVRSNKRQSVFDQIFGSYERKEIQISSQPINIEVSALPNNANSASFTGAVGDFKLKLTTNKTTLKANEALDLKLTISGQGNFPLLSVNDLNLPPDFEVYDPDIANNFKITYNGSSGNKEYKYLVIPRHEGSYTIDSYEFTYFDLKSNQFKILRSEPISIQVEKGVTQGNVVYQKNQKEDIKMLNSDIRFIHTKNLALVSAANQFYGSAAFYFSILIFFLLAFTLWILAKKRNNQQADYAGLRKSKANKLAKKRLSKAKKHLDQGDQRSFYEEISAALYGYYADKYNIEIANLSEEKILELFGNDENVNEIKKQLATVLQEAEMARFAPSSQINDRALYEKAVNIISQTENLKA